MIAAVCGWHTHHRATAEEISRRLAAGQELVVAAPALIEAYAVLTRLPAPHRLSAADAFAVLDANFIVKRRVVALDSRAYVEVLSAARLRATYGGRTYDAVIARCAAKVQATTLLTLNHDDFTAWGSDLLMIAEPA